MGEQVKCDEHKPVFQILILKNDYGQSVEVREVESVDLAELQRHLLQGESVFITSSFRLEDVDGESHRPSSVKSPTRKTSFNGSANPKRKKREHQNAFFYVADD